MSKQCYYCNAQVEGEQAGEAGKNACFRHMKWCCCKCGVPDAPERYSLDIYAGHYCNKCWDKSGYRKEGKEGYSYLDAGEYYDEDEY